MVKVVKQDDLEPICPHCKAELSTVFFRELDKDLGKKLIYFCPECRCCLGVSHRKGLTFGW